MNKDELITTLQSCLFYFDDLNPEQILNLNPEYEKEFVFLCYELVIFLKNFNPNTKLNEVYLK